jgi:hypothetical protein
MDLQNIGQANSSYPNKQQFISKQKIPYKRIVREKDGRFWNKEKWRGFPSRLNV